MPKIAFTEATTDKIISSVRAGNYLKTAAARANVSYRAVLGWLEQGKNDENDKHHKFYLAVKRAEAEFEAEALGTIVNSANPKYLLEILARKDPANWSASSRTIQQVNDRLEEFVDFLVANLGDDQELVKKVLKIAAKYEEKLS